MDKIIFTLQEFPERDIWKIAKMLKISPWEVSKAQHEHIRKFRKCVSPLWDLKGYGKALKE